jgi:hypothetical protein
LAAEPASPAIGILDRGDSVLRPEPRWPIALTILLVFALLIFLPDRVRLRPPAASGFAALLVLAPMAAVMARPNSKLWPRIEHWTTFAFIAIAGLGNLAILRQLIIDMVRGENRIDGVHMLASSIAIWAVNVMMFSLLYWQLDRGGPTKRVIAPERPDWIFPQDQAPPEDLRANWRPQFIDYLYLGFATATAFSTTDAMPLTGRAKFAMMTESAISLVTLVVVGARAINVLGT